MIIAMTSTRGDQWILPLCLTTSLDWADRVVLSVHCPPGEEAYVEAVKQIVLDLPDHRWQRVDMMVVRDPIWSEMQHRQGMLERARNVFAQWKRPGDLLYTAIVDSDEVIYDPSGQMRQLAPPPPGPCCARRARRGAGFRVSSESMPGGRPPPPGFPAALLSRPVSHSPPSPAPPPPRFLLVSHTTRAEALARARACGGGSAGLE